MIIKEDAEGVRVLRLANPPSNVLSLGLLQSLRKETAAAAQDDAVRALVLSSSYPRYFSTGLDLSELTGRSPEEQVGHFGVLIDAFRELLALPKPTVAAIGGSAILGGWILAMACDFRLISEDGRVALSEIRMGFSPTPGLIDRLRQISSSPRLVKELVLRGRTLRAPEAFAADLVDAVVADGKVEEEALAQAKRLAKLPLPAYAAVKKALGAGLEGDNDALWSRSRQEAARFFCRDDVQEGLTAMRQKRRPRWDKSDV